MNSNICVLYKSNWSYKFPVPGPVAIRNVQQTNQNALGWLGRQWEIQTRRNYQQRKYHRYHRVESPDVFNVFNHLFPLLVISCKGKTQRSCWIKLNSKAQLIAGQRLAAQGEGSNDFPKWRFVGITIYSKSYGNSTVVSCLYRQVMCKMLDENFWCIIRMAKMKYYLSMFSKAPSRSMKKVERNFSIFAIVTWYSSRYTNTLIEDITWYSSPIDLFGILGFLPQILRKPNPGNGLGH